jgi:hypothetical protein
MSSTAPAAGPAASAPSVRPLQLPLVSDPRGTLLPIDFEGVPFVPRRLFIVRDVPIGGVRGCHAHRSAWQVLVCLGGRIRVELRRQGASREHLLSGAGAGLLVEPRTWTSQTYLDSESMLLVLASEPYDPASYCDDAY